MTRPASGCSTPFPAGTRPPLDGYRFAVVNTNDTIHVFGADMPEGNDSAAREWKFDRLRDTRRRMDSIILEAQRSGRGDTLFLLAGALGMESSDDDAYVVLTTPTNALYDASMFLDPLQRPGHWSGNPAFADLHTHSTRVRAFGEGEQEGRTGGLDHRFDQILASSGMLKHHIAASYTTYGNDGLHFRDSVNRLPNLAVPDSIAESLHAASDHLPVYADFAFERMTSGIREAPAPRLALISISPQPASDHITLRLRSPVAGRVQARLVDATGKTVLTSSSMMSPGESSITLDTRSLPSGLYGYLVESGAETIRGRMVVVK